MLYFLRSSLCFDCSRFILVPSKLSSCQRSILIEIVIICICIYELILDVGRLCCIILLCNTYLSFFDFYNTKGITTVTYHWTRGVKHTESVYWKGYRTCQIHQRIKIRAIGGWEVRLNFNRTRYIKSLDLNASMIILCLSK